MSPDVIRPIRSIRKAPLPRAEDQETASDDAQRYLGWYVLLLSGV